jgi:hypothetical protein
MRPRAVAVNVGLALAYAAAYIWCYVSFLHYHFEYVGYDLVRRDGAFLASSIAIAVLPVVCYRGMRAVSSALAILIYFVLYVPIILTFAFGSSKAPDEIVLVQLTFLFGMALIFLSDVVIVKSPFSWDLGWDLMPAVLMATIVSTLYMLFIYHGSLAFPSFGADLYEQRFANDALGAGLVTRYLSSWLATVLVPLCLSYGLTAWKPRYVAVGTAACVIMYMAAANKTMILLPFVYVAFYLFLRKRLPAIYPMLGGALSLLIAFLLVTANLGAVLFVAAAIVLHRTIGNGGQLTMAYYDFFSFHPKTDYSHVMGLRLLTHPYPYGDLIPGQVVGGFYWGPFTTANANFWATDGIAAMGLLGVAIISVGCALLFVVMNSVTRQYERLFVVLCFLPFVMTLLNQPLFSSFWSGGGFFMLLFFLFNKRSTSLADPGHAPSLRLAGA